MHKHGGDIYSNENKIDYSANINFLGMPESVKKAAKEAIGRSEHYPDVQCRKLKEAIGEKDGISPEYLFCGNGAADVIFSLALARRPERALLPIPSFYEYEQALNSVQCGIVPHLLSKENDFRLGEDILEKITPQTDLLFLCNPNNPTGELVRQSLMEKILRKCDQTETLLVVDECFNEFLERPEEHTMTPFVFQSRQLFVLKAFTKMYAMPGLRLGYGICSDEALLMRMAQVSQPWRVSVPAEAAGIAATKEADFVIRSRREILKQKEMMAAAMRRMGYKIYGSRANYIFFEGDPRTYEKMLSRGFVIRDCSNYRGLQKGFFRAAVRSQKENRAFLAALESCAQDDKGSE